jgi:PAS domain-containing protein
MRERRRQPEATALDEQLRQLPSLHLLDRLPVAILGVDSFGRIGYANRSCAEMLGYPTGETLARQQLPDLLHGHSARTPAECAQTLRNNSGVVDWNHNEEYVVRTKVSPPLLMRSTDTMLLVGLTDVTDWLWDATAPALGEGRSKRISTMLPG